MPVSKTSPQMGLLAVDVPAQEVGERVAGPSPDNLASFQLVVCNSVLTAGSHGVSAGWGGQGNGAPSMQS